MNGLTRCVICGFNELSDWLIWFIGSCFLSFCVIFWKAFRTLCLNTDSGIGPSGTDPLSHPMQRRWWSRTTRRRASSSRSCCARRGAQKLGTSSAAGTGRKGKQNVWWWYPFCLVFCLLVFSHFPPLAISLWTSEMVKSSKIIIDNFYIALFSIRHGLTALFTFSCGNNQQTDYSATF